MGIPTKDQTNWKEEESSPPRDDFSMVNSTTVFNNGFLLFQSLQVINPAHIETVY